MAWSAELSGDEQLLLAAGQETPEMKAVKDLQMPPPIPKGNKLCRPGTGDVLD
jgi:hypothetical protein